MTGESETDDRAWWQWADLADDVQVTLDHINGARERYSLRSTWPGWQLDAAKDYFDALNRLWSTRCTHLGEIELSKAPAASQLTKLLKALNESERTALLGMPSVAAFAAFEPAVLDHNVAGVTQRLADITPDVRELAGSDHRHFKEAWSRWRERGSGVSRVLGDLSRAVLVVRNNMMHGEKTRVGPDLERAERNRDVASVVLPVLADMLDFVLDRPSQKVAVYGTLRPGRPNHGLLSDLGGQWTPVTLDGVLDEAAGLPTFRFTPHGSATEAELLTAPDLAQSWERLDEFEGSRYVRHLGLFWSDHVPGVANVYVGAPGAAGSAGGGRLP